MRLVGLDDVLSPADVFGGGKWGVVPGCVCAVTLEVPCVPDCMPNSLAVRSRIVSASADVRRAGGGRGTEGFVFGVDQIMAACVLRVNHKPMA